MCDQDHYEQDLHDYVERGAVTRREFSAISFGAGMAFLLPSVANAVAVTETDVKIKTPDGVADCYFVHPATGAAAGVLDVRLPISAAFTDAECNDVVAACCKVFTHMAARA